MQATDVIADMLTRIRNAGSAGHKVVTIPKSRIKKAIADILLEENFIRGYDIIENKKQGEIKIKLKYVEGTKKPVIEGIVRVSKPGLRKYYGVLDLPKVIRGLGVAIVSTSKGIMTDKAARKNKVGGEVLAFVW